MSGGGYPLRPFLPADTMALRELFAQSIEELTAEDYDEEHRVAWASAAADAEEFADKLQNMVTLIVQQDGEYMGFGSLKDGNIIEMLYVHPYYAGEGVGSALLNALETIAEARGAAALTADVSDTAVAFFEKRGYEATQRNSRQHDDLWLSNTTMTKRLKAAEDQAARNAAQTASKRLQ